MPIRSVLSEEKQLSMAALSQTLPDRLLNSLPIKPLALYARSLHLALQLPILGTSESMGHHDSEIMDDRGIDRDDA
jgi:hypothetical protein